MRIKNEQVAYMKFFQGWEFRGVMNATINIHGMYIVNDMQSFQNCIGVPVDIIQNWDQVISNSITFLSNYFHRMHPTRIEHILSSFFDFSLCNKALSKSGAFDAARSKIYEPCGQIQGNKLEKSEGTF